MTIEQIKQKMEYGDYGVAGKMLGITTDAARMRFRRGDDEMNETLIKIINNRETLINQKTKD